MTQNDREVLENIESELSPDEKLEHFGKRKIVDDTGAGAALVAMLFSMMIMAYIPIDLIKGLFFLILIVSTSFLVNSFIHLNKELYLAITNKRLIAYGKEGFFDLCNRDAIDEIDFSDNTGFIEYHGKRIKLKPLSRESS